MAKKTKLSNEQLLQEIKKLITPQIVYIQTPYPAIHTCPPCFRQHYLQQTIPQYPWYGGTWSLGTSGTQQLGMGGVPIHGKEKDSYNS